MKKIAKKLRRPAKHSANLRSGRSNPLIAMVVITIVALVGIGLLRASSAQSLGTIIIEIRNKTNNAPVNGALIALGGAPCQGQTDRSAYTNVNGVATFLCESGSTYFFSDVSYPGYHSVLDGSGYIPGTRFVHPGYIYITMYVAPWPAPAVSLTANPATITKGASSTLNWSTDYTDSCSTAGGWQSPTPLVGSKVVAPVSTTTYTMTCSGANYSGTNASKSVTVTVNNPPAPTPPPPAPAPTTKPPSAPPSSSTKKTTTPAATPPPAPAIVVATTGDTSAPNRPENTTSNTEGDKVIITWSPATDNVGVSAYQVERSTDQLEWKIVAENLAEPKFEDLEAVKGVHYYYRIRSIDAAGNKSEATFADIEIPIDQVASAQKSNVAVKNGGSSKAMLAVVGSLLVLGSLGGGAFYFTRRRLSSSYDDEVRLNSFDNAINTTEPTSPHASESLKEMVMHDKDPK